MAAEAAELERDSGGNTAKTRNGKVKLRTLNDIDGRTAAYRRFVELVAAYTSDLGSDLTTAESAIVQRVVSLQVWLEDAEASYAKAGDLDIATYTTASNALRRLLQDIGLQRRSRDVTPDLASYVTQPQK